MSAQRMWRWFGALLGGVLAGSVALTVVNAPQPALAESGAPTADPAVIARGQYLAEHVMVCMDCHSRRDFSKFAGPRISGSEGGGGEIFDEKMGIPGKVVSRNITPHGIGDWTDEEIKRAIMQGISADGSPLFPLMPSPSYARADERDIDAVIAYIRTLKPIKNELPSSVYGLPLEARQAMLPKGVPSATRPDSSDSVAYGGYLTTIAACMDCHTQMGEKGPQMDKYMAGGTEFNFPNGTVRTANITPDKETGLGTWDKASFIAKFRAFSDPSAAAPVGASDMNTPMPWYFYAGMTDEDLGAIYDYLRTIPAVANRVEKFTPNAPTAEK